MDPLAQEEEIKAYTDQDKPEYVLEVAAIHLGHDMDGKKGHYKEGEEYRKELLPRHILDCADGRQHGRDQREQAGKRRRCNRR